MEENMPKMHKLRLWLHRPQLVRKNTEQTWLLWKGSQKKLCNNNIAAQLRFVKLYLNKAQKLLSFGEKCSHLILKAEEDHIRKALSECGYSSWTCCESWEVP